MIGFEVAALSVALDGEKLVTMAYTGPEEFQRSTSSRTPDPISILDPVLRAR